MIYAKICSSDPHCSHVLCNSMLLIQASARANWRPEWHRKQKTIPCVHYTFHMQRYPVIYA